MKVKVMIPIAYTDKKTKKTLMSVCLSTGPCPEGRKSMPQIKAYNAEAGIVCRENVMNHDTQWTDGCRPISFIVS